MAFTIFLFVVAALLGYAAYSVDKWGEEQRRIKAARNKKANQHS